MVSPTRICILGSRYSSARYCRSEFLTDFTGASAAIQPRTLSGAAEASNASSWCSDKMFVQHPETAPFHSRPWQPAVQAQACSVYTSCAVCIAAITSVSGVSVWLPDQDVPRIRLPVQLVAARQQRRMGPGSGRMAHAHVCGFGLARYLESRGRPAAQCPRCDRHMLCLALRARGIPAIGELLQSEDHDDSAAGLRNGPQLHQDVLLFRQAGSKRVKNKLFVCLPVLYQAPLEFACSGCRLLKDAAAHSRSISVACVL